MPETAEEKVCFITGASGRLGKAMALALAQRGYAVCFTYRTSLLEARQTLKELRQYSRGLRWCAAILQKCAQLREHSSSLNAAFLA